MFCYDGQARFLDDFVDMPSVNNRFVTTMVFLIRPQFEGECRMLAVNNGWKMK